MAYTTRLSESALRLLPWLWQILGKSWRGYALGLSWSPPPSSLWCFSARIFTNPTSF